MTTLLLTFFCATPVMAGEGGGESSVAAAAATATEPWRVEIAKPDPLLEGLSEAEILRLGRQMYQDGLLPDGEVMEGYIRGDIEVDSTAFSCASCHQRAGLGSFEGGVVTPPTTGKELYQPYRRPPSLNDVDRISGRYIYAKTILERPAYNRETLKHALLTGEDPVGELFNDVMPRYPLGDRALAILVRYLELLSLDFSPGAANGNFRFATIITDDVSARDREAALQPLQRFIYEQNQQVAMFRNFIKSGYTPTGDMRYAFRSASLAIWDLKGPPETWGEQLAAYQDRDQVFAVLGGISNQDWRPIHTFCESRRLPCLFPVTNLPVVSDHDWYTFYFNKGYYQEGDAAAHFLYRHASTDGVLQLIQDSPAGRALAAGFTAGSDDLGQQLPVSLTLSDQQLQDPQALAALLAERKPRVLLLWADASVLPALAKIPGGTASPTQIFVSSTLLGKALAEIPETAREQVFISWPFRLKPYVGDEEGTGFLSRKPIETTWKSFGAPRITSRIATVLDSCVIEGLQDIENNLYRDHLLDEMSMQMDRVVFDYERISFGPGQRYISKGCYIIQLGPGPEPELIPRSEWVIH
ncbi:ABC transporter substrate-binding protein [Desulfuromonas sp. DDH964]|uniref:ABC transporter substrate-binding protein n=1 Tax=Desulfuromonas sp. DDH964 TaxID=1823759 RepID=UPI00082D10FF|nr:ABC transporter substrate-binding protein [Desulfuromonas sp. DDH964]